MQDRVLLVRVVIKTPDDRFLLLRRSERSNWSGGKYELPGGKIDPQQESMPEAVKREVSEETGIALSVNPPVFHMLTEEWQEKSYIIAAYLVELPQKPSIVLSREHTAYEWASMQDIQRFSLTSHTHEILKQAFGVAETSVKQSIFLKVDDRKTPNSELIIYTDGGSRGNPGPSASGYVIMDAAETVLEEGGEYLGLTTNNQAEYQAVKLALEQAAKYHPKKITFRIDSELVVRQMNGQYQIKNRDLWPVHGHIKELVALYPKVTFTHVRRELNTLADAKVNEILNTH